MKKLQQVWLNSFKVSLEDPLPLFDIYLFGLKAKRSKKSKN